MKNFDINHLVRTIKMSNAPVVLFGAGKYGKLALYALEKLEIKVNYFCDDTIKNKYLDIPIISPDKLNSLQSDANIFICSSYAIDSIDTRLKEKKFSNIFNCINLFENTDFSSINSDNMNFYEIRRRIELYKEECNSIETTDPNSLDIKYVDIVITEACSMKCESCSNLMQYYIKPRNSDFDLLFKSIDKLMNVTNTLYEFRILGGEPFVNKQIGKIVYRLLEYKNSKNIVIYTNATIIPKNENFECLKNSKVLVDITNYGNLSKRHDELIEIFKLNNIKYTTNIPIWTDSGTINYQKKSEEKLIHMFKNCCVNDILTLLNGKLYRCPFSANATNIKSIPVDESDYVDLSDDNKNLETIKNEIRDLYKNKKYLTACSYCNGRDYTTPIIKAAIQTKKTLVIPPIPEAN